MTTPMPAPLLSRVADSVYWMGRYIERAENVARFIGVNQHLMLDLASGEVDQWQPLVDITGDRQAFLDRYGPATEQSVIRFLAFDADSANSILSSVRAARENARSVRETISSEMWEQVNTLYLSVNSAVAELSAESLPEFFRSVRMACHLFQGIADGTMSHNEAWHFLNLGRDLERADKTTRILDVKYFILLPSVADIGTPYDDIQWSAVLKSVSGFEMYRKRHGRIHPRNIVQFLVTSGEFPRAVRYCINHADRSLRAVTGSPTGTFTCNSERRLGLLRSELDYAQVDPVLVAGLHEFLDGLQKKMNRIDECILEDFFGQRPLSG